jgi:hypothetical protein
LYVETLASERLIGNRCSDYFAVVNDKCKGSGLVMGGDSAKTADGVYLVKTTSKAPFARRRKVNLN